ncbi:MAG TPA: hypothetical protein VGM31_00250 [Puia sp.]
MRLPLTLIISLTTGLASYAQYDADQLEHLSIDHRLFYKRDTVYSFYILRAGYAMKPDVTKTYYWSKQDTILCTTGGYDGRLLNGAYKIFYPGKNLKESGQFKKGLKTGEWRTWYTGGRLASITYWKNGRQYGASVLYDESGKEEKARTRVHSKKDSLP